MAQDAPQLNQSIEVPPFQLDLHSDAAHDRQALIHQIFQESQTNGGIKPAAKPTEIHFNGPDKFPRIYLTEDAQKKTPVAPAGPYVGARFPDHRIFANIPMVPESVTQTYQDGFFMAGLSSLTTSPEGRNLISSMIKNNGDNTFTITFPGDKSHPVTLERKDLPWADHPDEEFLRPTNFNQLLELAFIKRQYGRVDDIKHFADVSQADDLDGPIKTPDAALKLLTGNEPKHLVTADNKVSVEELKKALVDGLDRLAPITAKTGPAFLIFFGRHQPLWEDHTWSVLGYDEFHDEVSVRDTLGRNAYWQDGRTIDGITSHKGGYFTMSLKKFHDHFDFVDIGSVK